MWFEVLEDLSKTPEIANDNIDAFKAGRFELIQTNAIKPFEIKGTPVGKAG
jgi:hypothetical protein